MIVKTFSTVHLVFIKASSLPQDQTSSGDSWGPSGDALDTIETPPPTSDGGWGFPGDALDAFETPSPTFDHILSGDGRCPSMDQIDPMETPSPTHDYIVSDGGWGPSDDALDAVESLPLMPDHFTSDGGWGPSDDALDAVKTPSPTPDYISSGNGWGHVNDALNSVETPSPTHSPVALDLSANVVEAITMPHDAHHYANSDADDLFLISEKSSNSKSSTPSSVPSRDRRSQSAYTGSANEHPSNISRSPTQEALPKKPQSHNEFFIGE